MQMRIDTKENGDGVVTATWYITISAITKEGNREIQEFEENIKKESKRIPMIIGQYMETGKMVPQ